MVLWRAGVLKHVVDRVEMLADDDDGDDDDDDAAAADDDDVTPDVWSTTSLVACCQRPWRYRSSAGTYIYLLSCVVEIMTLCGKSRARG